jgi:anti-sigma factor RsiW
MNSGVQGDCGSDEVLSAFVDGRLSDDEGRRVTAHLAECARCRELVSSVVIAGRESEASHVIPFRRRWQMPGLVAAAIVTAAGLLVAIGPGLRDADRRGSELIALVDAVGTERPIEPRITGGFEYGRVPRTTRGTGRELSLPIRVAIARIEKAYANRPSPEIVRARATGFLVEGRADRALSLLEEMVAGDSAHAGIWSDLSAAYLTRGDPGDPARALEAAERALRTDGRLLEALFNCALALERLDRRNEARLAWQRYIGVDPLSGWAEEARDHLAE